MLVVNFHVPNDEEQEMHDVMPVIEREETEREEAESDNDSIEDTVPTFVSTMDSRWARNIEKQEARWIEFGLDKAVPKPKLKSQSQQPTKKSSKTTDAEKRTSKRVREKTTTNKRPVQVHLPDPQPTLQHQRKKGKTMFDDEWEINGEEQPPDKGDLMNREQGYFYCEGNVIWIAIAMLKRRTVTLSRKGSKKEKQVLVHWMYKNEKTWQQESGVLSQLQGHYDALVLKELKKK
jgi:hypothetical protein